MANKGVSGLINNPKKMQRMQDVLSGKRTVKPDKLRKKLKKIGFPVSQKKRTLRSGAKYG